MKTRLIISIICIALFYLVQRKKPINLSIKIPDKTIFLVFGSFFIAYLFIKFNRHLSLNTFGFDLGAFDYAYYNTFQGNFLFTPFFGQCYLKEHFFPAMITILPFYAILKRPETLLVIQALMVALTAIPFFYIAKHLTKESLASLIFTIALMMNPFLMRGMEYDFHIEMLRPLLIATLFLCYLKDKTVPYYIILVFYLFTKEIEWMTGIAFSAGLFLYSRKWRYVLPTLIISISVGLFILLFVNRFYATGFDYYMTKYQTLGNTPLQILVHVITHPLVILNKNTIAQAVKLLVPLGFLPLLSPLAIASLPAFCIHMLSAGQQQNLLFFYYSSSVIIILFIAAVHAYGRLKERFGHHMLQLLLIPVFVLNSGYFRLKPVTELHRTARKIAKEIPAFSSVLADNELMPHFKRQRLFRCTYFIAQDFDLFDHYFFNQKKFPWLLKIIEEGPFQRAGHAGDYVYYKRKR